MVRKGRKLEIIIQQLEMLVTDEDVEIKSPDYIYDKVAQIEREVDISIKGKLGTHKLLIIIECRDRPSGPKENLLWIEQIYTKTKDINANKVLAVTTTDYTPAAKTKADFYGIELRFLKELNPTEVQGWLETVSIEMQHVHHEILNVNMGLMSSLDKVKINPENIRLVNKSVQKKWEMKAGDEIFVNESTGNRTSLNGLISSCQEFINKDILPNTTYMIKKFHLLFYDPSHMLLYEVENEFHRVIRLDLEVQVLIKHYGQPVKKAFKYMSESEKYAERIDHCWNLESGEELTFSVQRDVEMKKQNVIFMINNK